MGKIADFTRKLLGVPKGERDRRVSAVMVAVLKSEEGPFHWDWRGTSPSIRAARGGAGWTGRTASRGTACGYRRQVPPYCTGQSAGWPATPRYAASIQSIPPDFGICGYPDWHNAKYGATGVRQFAKPRVARALGGMVRAAAVTPGRANDSPYLREMLAGMPRGSGHMQADAQYCGVENCRAVRDSGRRAVIEPRTDYKIEGEDARAEMLRFLEERPGTFRKLLRKRNNVECVFSSMKERFGGVVRAVKTKTQTVELPSACICYNMAFARGLRRGGGDGPRMRGSLRSHVSKLPETGPARPPGPGAGRSWRISAAVSGWKVLEQRGQPRESLYFGQGHRPPTSLKIVRPHH